MKRLLAVFGGPMRLFPPIVLIGSYLIFVSSSNARAGSLADCTSADDAEAAVAACAEVIADSKASSKDLLIARLERANAYAEIGDYDYAGRDFDAAVELDPSNVAALYSRGKFRVARNDLDRGIQDFTAALALSPDDPKLYVARGLTLFRRMKYDEAIADYASASERSPEASAPVNARSCALIRKGDYDGALAEAERAIALAPAEAPGYINRATAHAKKGEDESALNDYNKAIEIDPSGGLALAARFRYLAGRDMIAEAKKDMDALLTNEEWQTQVGRYYGIVCLD